MKRILSLLIILLALFFITLYFIFREADLTLGPVSPQPREQEEIENAILQEIEQTTEGIPVFQLYNTQIDDILVSRDGNWATAWLTPIDPDNGQIVPTEPGLVILLRIEDEWKVYLPSDSQWLEASQSIPSELLNDEEKDDWLQKASLNLEALALGTFTGYRLPWAGGETRSMTQSVGHDRYTPSGNAHFAFDFATGGYPSGMYNIHASRAGVLTRVRWTQANGDPASPGNYLVLEDTSTSPTTYQLYLHFAKDSIPPELRVPGVAVAQGQFLGVADDTGVSSGNHLHFMVHTNPTSYWGTSVDITFDDVGINGGRPRISSDLAYCKSSDICNTTQTSYVSGNYLSPDHTPPGGVIVSPQQNTVLGAALNQIRGWAFDTESGLASIQLIARYDGTWHPIGNPFSSSPFTVTWDVCTNQVPDGPIGLALQLRDSANNQANNLPGLVHIFKSFSCPVSPSACQPNSSQVGLFADPDYKGSCVVLNAGSYTSAALGALSSDNTASILVGSGVRGTLFSDDSFVGRSETLILSDSNLSDNRIGKDTASSVIIQAVTSLPAIPVHVWPTAGLTYPSDATVSLSWRDTAGAAQFQARLMSGTTQVAISPWQSESAWHINTIPPGSYTWQVKAKNSAGESGWSNPASLIIQVSSPGLLTPINPPFTDNMESQTYPWVPSNYWDVSNLRNHTPGGSLSWGYDTNASQGYDTGVPNSGYLTSPRFNLPAGSQYYLRFWYSYETEGKEIHWDQRWVQISVDDGPFANLLQLSEDVPNTWHRSPSIPLSPYSGHTVRFRFYFTTLDNRFNNYLGWFIDDFEITANAPPACSDADNSPAQARQIQYGSQMSGDICPEGDIDYYKFTGNPGDQVGVKITAQTLGSNLDSYLYLLDTNGYSVLAENDDQVLYDRIDSALAYRILRPGTYYLKIRAWDHPTSGGTGYPYTIQLFRDNQKPIASFINPVGSDTLPLEPIILQVAASDVDSGISRVQFFWHDSDWVNSNWIYLGEDWDGDNGWNSPEFDVGSVSDARSIGFFARVFDWAGNWTDVGFWNHKPAVINLPIVIKPQ